MDPTPTLNDAAANEFFGKSFALAGPSPQLEAARLPVRGDLAHIRMAGKYFVPHYAVPMAASLPQGAELLASLKADALTLASLPAGSAFDVLDMAGAWAWGECPETGLVGYVPLARLTGLPS